MAKSPIPLNLEVPLVKAAIIKRIGNSSAVEGYSLLEDLIGLILELLIKALGRHQMVSNMTGILNISI